VDIIPSLGSLQRATRRRSFPKVKCRALNRGAVSKYVLLILLASSLITLLPSTAEARPRIVLQARQVSRPSCSPLPTVPASTPLSSSTDLRLIAHTSFPSSQRVNLGARRCGSTLTINRESRMIQPRCPYPTGYSSCRHRVPTSRFPRLSRKRWMTRAARSLIIGLSQHRQPRTGYFLDGKSPTIVRRPYVVGSSTGLGVVVENVGPW